MSLNVGLLVHRFECGLACMHQIHHLVEWGEGRGCGDDRRVGRGEDVEVTGKWRQDNSTFDCLRFIFRAQ